MDMPQTNLNLGRLLPAPSLKEMALATIKEAMFSKKLAPEVMYTEAALTNELGISRTPVREALIHLASRGLITYFPRKGFKIKLLTEKDAENLFEEE
jgi:DNA-binding GntR family transcriptional regulator